MMPDEVYIQPHSSLSLSLLPSCFHLTPPLSLPHSFPAPRLSSLPPSLSSPESKPTTLISGSSLFEVFSLPSPSLMVRLKCHSTQGHPTHTAGGGGTIFSAIFLSRMCGINCSPTNCTHTRTQTIAFIACVPEKDQIQDHHPWKPQVSQLVLLNKSPAYRSKMPTHIVYKI